MFGITPYNHDRHFSYNPFREMEELERRLFQEPFGEFYHSEDIAEFKTDITDCKDHYLLEADLPGFDKENIKLDLNGDVLTLNAERHSNHEDKDKKGNYVRCERSYGKYSRQFDVSSIDTSKITAKYENGVLKLVLPKKEEVLPEAKTIEIE